MRRRMESLAGVVTALAGVVVLAVAALQGATAAPNSAGVSMLDFSFSPASVTVKKGESVTWVNNGQAPHTATANDGSFDTGLLTAGQSGTVTFNNAGSFDYVCVVHPEMVGTVVVSGGDEPLPETGDPISQGIPMAILVAAGIGLLGGGILTARMRS